MVAVAFRPPAGERGGPTGPTGPTGPNGPTRAAGAPAARLLPTGRLRLRLSAGRNGRAALGIYRPLTRRGRLLRAALSAASVLPAGRAAADPLVARLADLLQVRIDGACVMASSMSGRSIVGLAHDGRLLAVAKVGRPEDTAVRHEAEVLARLQSRPGLRVPRLIAAGSVDGLLVCVTEPVAGRAQADRAGALQVALALAGAGWTHGDLAPWNLVGQPATLLDWEIARPELLPLSDLAHYVIRCEAQLGRRSAGAVVRQLCGPGSLGASYLAELGLPLARAPELVRGYLDRVAAANSAPADAGLHQAISDLLR
jgi:hypothetical protein